MSSPDVNQPSLEDTIHKSQVLFNELKKYSDHVIAEMDSMLDHVNQLRVLSDLLEKTVNESKLKIYNLTGDIGKYEETKKEIDTNTKVTANPTRKVAPTQPTKSQPQTQPTPANTPADNVAIKGRLLSVLQKR